ncbi:heavy-metal-associated domain-containing protein [Janibacter limosus]|jgi:copper chaperone CopZ|uniref:heavy-metal-associated domain-containing protein n=1 Tax=Janibacter limosus TaxID=53458 RepID=UPI0008361AB2|nr:heavy-metal-associated domain-containing protein [Janibacter limosus]
MSTTTEYRVTGMTCGHCEAAVREEVGGVAGVQDLTVSAETGSLVVTGSDIDDTAVIAAVTEAGYQAAQA